MIEFNDPRVDGEHVSRRPSSTTDGDVVLVGVVHDHPASTFRVRTVIESVDPDVLALELPPLAVGLFEQYARDARTPPAFGGEMSAAIQAARPGTAGGVDRVVGIDGPSVRFAGRMARRLWSERPALSTARTVIRGLSTATRRAAVCRLGAGVAASTGLRLEVDSPVVHESDWQDAPEVQADDERTQIRRSQAMLNAFGSCRASRACDLRNETREEHMAARLADLRDEGDVVAVVGIDHLDPLSAEFTDD
ncbi:hypothetical protein [Halorarum halobium]|uniref:hypothetical protein n=1 Tax=Halorarum halobium TaxID=3075121 RepID=UPI0028B0CD11|nr:hypothetical protein [Halobaculum sp. XH14]